MMKFRVDEKEKEKAKPAPKKRTNQKKRESTNNGPSAPLYDEDEDNIDNF